MDRTEETTTARTFKQVAIERTSRAGTEVEIYRAKCPECGRNLDRVMNLDTYEWKAEPAGCLGCGAEAPWERGWNPVTVNHERDLE